MTATITSENIQAVHKVEKAYNIFMKTDIEDGEGLKKNRQDVLSAAHELKNEFPEIWDKAEEYYLKSDGRGPTPKGWDIEDDIFFLIGCLMMFEKARNLNELHEMDARVPGRIDDVIEQYYHNQ